MAYTTKGNIQNYLAIDIDSSYDTEIDDWISAVTAWINRYTGVNFEADTDSTRYYDGNGSRIFTIDPVVDTPTTLQILDVDGSVEATLTEGIANDYLLYPLNETPKYELQLTDYASVGVFPSRQRSVAVTAKFGHSEEVPEDIKTVSTKLASALIDKGLNGGKLARVKLGDYDGAFQTINEHAEPMGIYKILDLYRDIEI